MSDFIKIVDAESQEVNTIREAMCHPQKNEARRLLMFVNRIVDYYLVRQKEEKVCYPIVCIPNSPNWARSVVLEFLIIKMSLFYNSQKVEELGAELKKDIIAPDDDPNYCKNEIKFRRYIRPILKQLKGGSMVEGKCKNLIFCSEDEVKASKNPYINKYFGPYDDVCYNSNLTICTDITSNDIRSQMMDSNETIVVDNIFVIYTNNEKCNSLADAATSRIGNGIRNCFVFDFINKPFRLYSIRQKRISLGRKLPMLPERMALTYEHFMALTEEESKMLYNIEQERQHIYIPDDQLFYIDQIGYLIDNSDYPIRDKTHFSLCLDEERAKEYAQNLKDANPNYAQEYYQLSIDYQLEIAKSKIIPLITAFVGNAPSIAIILPYDSTQQEKRLFNRILPQVPKITFHSYSDLKRAKKKNKIKESLIINFVYRPHYANTPYYKYPNSFDPYTLNEGQKILDIINGYIFENIYLWDKYRYEELVYHLLDSEFRHSHMLMPERPSKPKFADEIDRETDFDDEKVTNRSIRSFKVVFEDGSNISVPETELVVVDNGSGKYICGMGKLADSEETSISLQKLEELEAILEYFMQEESEKASEREWVIRDSFYKQEKISILERDSKHMLWKILLAHKVGTLGEKKVYTEIMSSLKESDRVSEKAFELWHIVDSSMMLPSRIVCQKRLIEYLGLNNTPYLNIARTLKRVTKNNTRELNAMKDEFMFNMLFQDINSDKYEEFEDSKLNNEILHLKNVSELKDLVGMIEEGVNIKQVKSIKLND